MVYEANARVRDPVYGCVGAISSLQQQIDVLQTQLAVAQAEAVHLRVRQTASSFWNSAGHSPTSPTYSGSPSSKINESQQAKHIFDMDMVVDQAAYGDSMWWCNPTIITKIKNCYMLYTSRIYLDYDQNI